MSNITTLNPPKLWQWFATICSIPHASYHEEALANHILSWAKNKNFAAHRDEAGNVFITKPATKGMENRAPIALQAHLDMVTQANGAFDFLTQPIVPQIISKADGDWVTASGTTLGADNGIGLASILAVLDATDLAHGEIEALLTMTEETGMDGALGLQPNVLKSRLMINTDTEEIGEIYLGCAGGIDADLTWAGQTADVAADETGYSVRFFGLQGGHSGLDIDKNNANAIKLLAGALAFLPVRVASLTGGTARNAIPRAATAVVYSDDGLFSEKMHAVAENIGKLIGEFEAGFAFEIVPLADKADAVDASKPLTKEGSEQLLALINAVPNGVIRQSDKVADTVETSSSLGKIKLENGALQATCLIRSLDEFGKTLAEKTLASIGQAFGADVEFKGGYVGWNPNPNSPLTAIVARVYAQVIGEKVDLKVIHAGLECGLIQRVYPDMDIVSIGPTIKNAHSPDECVKIDTVETYWRVLIDVLANAPLADGSKNVGK